MGSAESRAAQLLEMTQGAPTASRRIGWGGSWQDGLLASPDGGLLPEVKDPLPPPPPPAEGGGEAGPGSAEVVVEGGGSGTEEVDLVQSDPKLVQVFTRIGVERARHAEGGMRRRVAQSGVW